MEKNYGLTDLNENELKELNGGAFPMLIIKAFIPRIDRIIDFFEGLNEGYTRATAE
jgi:hypothetical protein